MVYGKIWMRNRLKKNCEEFKNKGKKKRVNHVFLHKYKYAFFYKREKYMLKICHTVSK